MTVCLRAARRVWQADAIGDATLQFHIYALNESSSQEEVDRARIRAYAQLSGGRAGGCAEWDGQRSEGGGGGRRTNDDCGCVLQGGGRDGREEALAAYEQQADEVHPQAALVSCPGVAGGGLQEFGRHIVEGVDVELEGGVADGVRHVKHVVLHAATPGSRCWLPGPRGRQR